MPDIFSFFLVSHSYFLSSGISTASNSLLLPSGCSLSFLYMNTFFPDIPFPSHLLFLPLLTPSYSTTNWLNSEGKADSSWFLRSDLGYSVWALPLCFGSSCSETLSGKGKGELAFCEIWLDRVTPHSYLLSKASFPTIDISALWLHWDYVHKITKSSIWCMKKSLYWMSISQFLQVLLFPIFIRCNLTTNQFIVITTIQPCLSAPASAFLTSAMEISSLAMTLQYL